MSEPIRSTMRVLVDLRYVRIDTAAPTMVLHGRWATVSIAGGGQYLTLGKVGDWEAIPVVHRYES